jgi:hypothetical protein
MTTPFDSDNCVKQNLYLKGTSNNFTIDLNEQLKNVVSIKHTRTFIQLSSVPIIGNAILIRINDYDLLHYYNGNDLIRELFVGIPITSTDTSIIYISDGYANLSRDPQSYSPNPKISKIPKIKIELLNQDGTALENVSNVFIELTVYSESKLITQA